MATAVDVAQVIYNKLGWVDAWKLEKLMLGSWRSLRITAKHGAWAGTGDLLSRMSFRRGKTVRLNPTSIARININAPRKPLRCYRELM